MRGVVIVLHAEDQSSEGVFACSVTLKFSSREFPFQARWYSLPGRCRTSAVLSVSWTGCRRGSLAMKIQFKKTFSYFGLLALGLAAVRPLGAQGKESLCRRRQDGQAG